MNTIATVYEYHDRTKHHPNRYAPSLGYMDWATQPDPFRAFDGAETVMLPMPDVRAEPAYSALFGDIASEALSLQTLSVMLRYSLGLAAIKCMGTDCWALRCNASSGNLHPTEGYVVLPPLEGISGRSVVAHYAPKTHSLEILHQFESTYWESVPEGAFLFGITSIPWREAWKYGERAFRYTQLDAGHAIRAVQVAARLNGWHATLDAAVDMTELDTLLGTNRADRFVRHEDEIPDALMMIAPAPQTAFPEIAPLCSAHPFDGKANTLSPSHHLWEAIDLVERATRWGGGMPPETTEEAYESTCAESAEKVILQRRSARAMDFGRTHISLETFTQLMYSARSACRPFEPATSLVLFIHDVETLEPGLYLYLLNEHYLDTLKSKMRSDLLFQPSGEHLYLLEAGDFKPQAKFISCSQDIASDGAFSLGMLCEFEPQLERFGAQRYKSLYWECGAIGQQLYLEATSLGLSATGIGCFLDDVMHRLLGLEGHDFQSLYHFTIGHAIPDLRLQTRMPYETR